jgi:hypothetical protein
VNQLRVDTFFKQFVENFQRHEQLMAAQQHDAMALPGESL